jgi:hypothetical protein
MSSLTATYQSTRTEEELRTSIALNRGMEWLKNVNIHEKHRIYHTSASIGHLEGLFYETHRQLFQDWNGSNDRVSGETRMKLREALATTFFAKDKEGNPQGLFDENGFGVRLNSEDKMREKFAEKLAEFYEKARLIRPYGYGNKLTLDFFMVAISKLPPFAEAYPEGIDFRRLDKKDLQAMADPAPEHGEIVTAFRHATDSTRTHPLKDNYKPHGENGYRTWGDKTEMVGDVPFLSHMENGITYLVTMNGGLIRLDSIKNQLEEHLKNNGLLSDFPKLKAEKYLTSPETLAEKLKSELQNKLDNLKYKKKICGVKIEDGKAPLVCLDINIISGLREAEHNKLMAFLKKNSDLIQSKSSSEKITLPSSMYDSHYKKGGKEAFMKKLKEKAGDNLSLIKILDTAYDWSNANSLQIEKIADEKLAGKTTQVKPVAYLNMGGSDSGKEIVKKMASAKFKGDFVISSLDNFSAANDIHTLLLATGHHADDYALVEPFAMELRDYILARATENKLNIFCDGSGIFNKLRHEKTTKALKESGFYTHVVAIDSLQAESGAYE